MRLFFCTLDGIVLLTRRSCVALSQTGYSAGITSDLRTRTDILKRLMST